MYFRTPTFPKNLKIGDKVFVIIDNKIIGYHKFVACIEMFIEWGCEITSNTWPPGKYIVRDGTTWRQLKVPKKSKSHRGFRYVK